MSEPKRFVVIDTSGLTVDQVAELMHEWGEYASDVFVDFTRKDWPFLLKEVFQQLADPDHP